MVIFFILIFFYQIQYIKLLLTNHYLSNIGLIIKLTSFCVNILEVGIDFFEYFFNTIQSDSIKCCFYWQIMLTCLIEGESICFSSRATDGHSGARARSWWVRCNSIFHWCLPRTNRRHQQYTKCKTPDDWIIMKEIKEFLTVTCWNTGCRSGSTNLFKSLCSTRANRSRQIAGKVV